MGTPSVILLKVISRELNAIWKKQKHENLLQERILPFEYQEDGSLKCLNMIKHPFIFFVSVYFAFIDQMQKLK